jgi:hypothetical protein
MTLGEVGQFLTGAAAAWAAINSMRNSRKIDAVHKATNGIVEKLVQTTKSESFAAGQKDEKEKGNGG